jgi:hypothetical protein
MKDDRGGSIGELTVVASAKRAARGDLKDEANEFVDWARGLVWSLSGGTWLLLVIMLSEAKRGWREMISMQGYGKHDLRAWLRTLSSYDSSGKIRVEDSRGIQDMMGEDLKRMVKEMPTFWHLKRPKAKVVRLEGGLVAPTDVRHQYKEDER